MSTLWGEALHLGRVNAPRRAADFFALTKPRLIPMVLVATAAGFYLAARGAADYALLLHTLLGTALATGGTLALNQAAEPDVDARMARTWSRPLPKGRLLRSDAVAFGATLTLAGVLYLALAATLLTAALTALAGVVYLFLYTPLKRRTPLNVIAGAVPGAMPPVIGWAAGAGGLGFEAAVLFAILFFWQIPHALAIALIYREEFARAGLRSLPVDEPDGKSTGWHVVNHCTALLPVAMMPTLIGLAGTVYFFVSLAMGLAYLAFGFRLAMERSRAAARRLFLVSLAYLPIVLLALVLDRRGF